MYVTDRWFEWTGPLACLSPFSVMFHCYLSMKYLRNWWHVFIMSIFNQNDLYGHKVAWIVTWMLHILQTRKSWLLKAFFISPLFYYVTASFSISLEIKQNYKSYWLLNEWIKKCTLIPRSWSWGVSVSSHPSFIRLFWWRGCRDGSLVWTVKKDQNWILDPQGESA